METEFPIFKTKSDDGKYKKFDLTDSAQRKEYFEYKAGPEIKKLQEYLKENTYENRKNFLYFNFNPAFRSVCFCKGRPKISNFRHKSSLVRN